jgi:hypothetical protein
VRSYKRIYAERFCLKGGTGFLACRFDRLESRSHFSDASLRVDPSAPRSASPSAALGAAAHQGFGRLCPASVHRFGWRLAHLVGMTNKRPRENRQPRKDEEERGGG